MPVIKCSLYFKKEVLSENVKFGGNVLKALQTDAANENPLFPDLPVSLKALTDDNIALGAADTGLINGGRTAREAANKAKKAWDVDMTSIANYVSTVANGNSQVVALAGFIPTKGTRQRQSIPDASTSFSAKINGTKGAIIAGSKKKVARSKAHVVTALPPGATISYTENTAVITIGDQNIYIGAFTGKETELYSLKSATPYSISMFSINAAGHGPATVATQVIPQ